MVEREEDPDELRLFGTTPQEARRILESRGFDEQKWDNIMKRGFDGIAEGSHEIRALITIARGNKTRLLGNVYREIRAKMNFQKNSKT